MRVALHDGLREGVFHFEPEGHPWKRETNEFLIGHSTGLPEPFERVFVKRLHGKPALGHDLLCDLLGQTLSGAPKVLGYAKSQESHLYFFQNLPTSYELLEHKLTDIYIIHPQIVLAIVKQAAEVFTLIFQHRHIYIDFCKKNIMLDYENNRVAIIDIDSSWPITHFLKAHRPRSGVGMEFWGLWNKDISNVVPKSLGNAQKTVVISFATVWSRAVALAHHPKRPNIHAAVKLIYSPGYDQQRELWDALRVQDKQGFLNYFMLSGANATPVYNQWQGIFEDFRNGREVPWQEIVNVTEKLLSAIDEYASGGAAVEAD